MDTLSAFARGMAAKGERQKVFDWVKAATIIKEKQPTEAAAGLGMDWEWTGGTIYLKGSPVMDPGTYLSSNWAIPELELDNHDSIECWRYADETPGWDSGTVWPPEALAILNGETLVEGVE